MQLDKEQLPKESENAHLWERFCRLGEMMGDGLHRESGGKWISKEYRNLARILVPETPEIKEAALLQRRAKAISIDSQMTSLLSNNKCSCGGELKQKRSGAKVAYCQTCNSRYVAKAKKA